MSKHRRKALPVNVVVSLAVLFVATTAAGPVIRRAIGSIVGSLSHLH